MVKLSTFLIIGIVSLLGLITNNIIYGQQPENITSSNEQIKFFAIQHAPSGSISEINASAYNLELNNVSDKTILFSDRPDRIVKTESTTNFIGNWSTGVDSFTVDAPNAVLVVDETKGQQDTTIIELYNPDYDSNSMSLKYEIIPDNSTSIESPNEFGQATIIIDLYRTPTA